MMPARLIPMLRRRAVGLVFSPTPTPTPGTGIRDQLIADAEVFVLTCGEQVFYTPLGEAGRNILAIVDRNPAASDAGGRAARGRIDVTACNRQTSIDDDEVGGIGSDELDTGGDTVTLPRRPNKTAAEMQLVRVHKHDEGLVYVEVG